MNGFQILEVLVQAVPHNETDLYYKDGDKNSMCDFIGYQLKDRLRMKKAVEEQGLEEALEFEKAEEKPITVNR